MEFKRDYIGISIFLFISIAFLVWWVRMKQGHDKRWFVRGNNLVSRGIYFALPSATIGMIVFLIGMLVWTMDPGTAINKSPISETISTICMIIFGGCIVVGYILAFFEPDWMSPEWFRWLKQEHSDILILLEREANELGRAKWFPMVETQEDLEAWVKEVRLKYGLRNYTQSRKEIEPPTVSNTSIRGNLIKFLVGLIGVFLAVLWRTRHRN